MNKKSFKLHLAKSNVKFYLWSLWWIFKHSYNLHSLAMRGWERAKQNVNIKNVFTKDNEINL